MVSARETQRNLSGLELLQPAARVQGGSKVAGREVDGDDRDRARGFLLRSLPRRYRNGGNEPRPSVVAAAARNLTPAIPIWIRRLSPAQMLVLRATAQSRGRRIRAATAVDSTAHCGEGNGAEKSDTVAVPARQQTKPFHVVSFSSSLSLHGERGERVVNLVHFRG